MNRNAHEKTRERCWDHVRSKSCEIDEEWKNLTKQIEIEVLHKYNVDTLVWKQGAEREK